MLKRQKATVSHKISSLEIINKGMYLEFTGPPEKSHQNAWGDDAKIMAGTLRNLWIMTKQKLRFCFPFWLF